MTKLDRSDIALGLIVIACGGFALLVASGVLPMQTAYDTWVHKVWNAVSQDRLLFASDSLLVVLPRHLRSVIGQSELPPEYPPFVLGASPTR